MAQKAFSPKQLTGFRLRIASVTGKLSHEVSSSDIPEENNEEEQESTRIDNTVSPQIEDESRKAIRIIMADDDCDDRELFQEAVEANTKNIQLEMATDGRILMDMLNKSSRLPDLIFLDLNMPYKSGMECLVELRQSDRLKHIPVLIYSTSSSQKDIDETYHNGANLYIKKPSDFNELATIVSRVISLDWDVYIQKGSRHQFLFTSKTA